MPLEIIIDGKWRISGVRASPSKEEPTKTPDYEIIFHNIKNGDEFFGVFDPLNLNFKKFKSFPFFYPAEVPEFPNHELQQFANWLRRGAPK